MFARYNYCMSFLQNLLTSLVLLIGSLIATVSGSLNSSHTVSLTQAATSTAQQSVNQSLQQGADTVLFMKKDQAYEMNIATKELRPYISPIDSIDRFVGLPKEVNNKEIIVSMNRVLLSARQDESDCCLLDF